MRRMLALLCFVAVGCELATEVGDFHIKRYDDSSGGGGGAAGGGGEAAVGGTGGEPVVGCGDGTVQSDEECDDSNAVDGDGCSAACVVECGDSSHKHPSTFHCYRWFGSPLSWSDAHQTCLALGSGWDLLAQSSEEERNFIDDVVDPPTGVWTGGNDRQGSYEWTNGEPWGYTPWGLGEPNFTGNCITTLAELGSSSDTIADQNCSVLNEYICERTPAGR